MLLCCCWSQCCSHWTALFWTYGIKTDFIKVSTKSSQLNAVFRSLNYSDFIDWISVEISSVALHSPDNNRSTLSIRTSEGGGRLWNGPDGQWTILCLLCKFRWNYWFRKLLATDFLSVILSPLSSFIDTLKLPKWLLVLFYNFLEMRFEM